MATQIPRDPVIGNFKPTKTEKAKERHAELNRPARQDREGNDDKYLAIIRKLPCCIPSCNHVGGDAHHLKSVPGTRGMALRAPDRYALPLCRYPHHDGVEKHTSPAAELKWFADNGLSDPIGLADALFAVPNHDKGEIASLVLKWKKQK